MKGILRTSLLLTALLLGACAAPSPIRRATAPSEGPSVRVGLAVDVQAVELSSTAGLEVVDVQSGRRVAQASKGEAIAVTAAPGGLSVAGASGLRLVSIRPRGGGILTIDGTPYRGAALVQAGGSGGLTVVNQVDMEAYLLGVVPKEIGPVGEELLEAAKAQAVAARTYAVRNMGRRESLGFDVYGTVQDQVYGGVEAEHGTVSRAVRETAGEILTYGGEPIQAFYSSTCGGHTASIHEVWPPERPHAYLTSVSDIDPASGEAFCQSSNRFEWTERWSVPELTNVLSEALADSLPAGASSIGELRDFRVLERTPEGRITALAINTAADSYVVGGDRIRWAFRRPGGAILNSAKFDVAIVRGGDHRPQEVVARGGGWGHGIGMCQVGAMGRARAGHDYRDILAAYYLRTVIQRVY